VRRGEGGFEELEEEDEIDKISVDAILWAFTEGSLTSFSFLTSACFDVCWSAITGLRRSYSMLASVAISENRKFLSKRLIPESEVISENETSGDI
jgi:hypothetical protein